LRQAKTAPVYPVLLAIYSPLALMTANLGQVALSESARILAASLLLAGLVYGVLRLALGSWNCAAPLAGWLLVLFFTYGHVYQLVEPLQVAGFTIGRHRYLILVWLALGLAGTIFLLRRSRVGFPDGLHSALNLTTAVLVVLSAGQLLISQARNQTPAAQSVSAQSGYGEAGTNLPDIYWIILDGYGRSDALLQDYGLDNAPFLKGLEELGFVIPDCTLSNYSVTTLSVASALHMDYVENFTTLVQPGEKDIDWLAYHNLLLDNPVRARLEALGYQTVAFETGYEFSDITDVDYFIVGNRNPLGQNVQSGDISDFEELFIRTTALRPLEELSLAQRKRLAPAIKTPEERAFDTVRFALDQMERLPEIEGRKFVIAHIMAQHPPFVFDRAGSFKVSKTALEGYAPEVEYLNKRILNIVHTLLGGSKTDPVIVIQGDHGWESHNRNRILNAYYLPGAAQKVYDQITPVNTFRLILDTYFGGQYGLIADKSLYSRHDDVYNFKIIPPVCVPETE